MLPRISATKGARGSESGAREEINAELIAQELGVQADGSWDFDIGEVYGN